MDIHQIRTHLLGTVSVSIGHVFHRLAEFHTFSVLGLCWKILEEMGNTVQVEVSLDNIFRLCYVVRHPQKKFCNILFVHRNESDQIPARQCMRSLLLVELEQDIESVKKKYILFTCNLEKS